MLKFFDSNCMIGMRNIYREGSLKTLDDFIQMLDLCGIEKALVYHCVSRDSDLYTGNKLLKSECADNPRLLKQWCIMPELFDLFPSASATEKGLVSNDVKAVRILPGSFRYSLDKFCFGALAEICEEHKLPIFMSKCEATWSETESFLKDFPNLRLVITDTGYRDLHRFTYLLARYENVFIETSTFVAHNAIKLICEKFGAERILFGSGMPTASAAAGVSLIRYSDISEEDKKKIAYDNLDKFISEVRL